MATELACLEHMGAHWSTLEHIGQLEPYGTVLTRGTSSVRPLICPHHSLRYGEEEIGKGDWEVGKGRGKGEGGMEKGEGGIWRGKGEGVLRNLTD